MITFLGEVRSPESSGSRAWNSRAFLKPGHTAQVAKERQDPGLWRKRGLGPEPRSALAQLGDLCEGLTFSEPHLPPNTVGMQIKA